MIKGRDIVVLGIQAWDIEIGSNCKNIATEFAKNNRTNKGAFCPATEDPAPADRYNN